MEKSALHSLSVSGEVNGAQGVCGLFAAKLFQCRLGKQTVPSAKATAKSLGWAQGYAWHQSQAGEYHQGILSFGFGALCQLEEEHVCCVLLALRC